MQLTILYLNFSYLRLILDREDASDEDAGPLTNLTQILAITVTLMMTLLQNILFVLNPVMMMMMTTHLTQILAITVTLMMTLMIFHCVRVSETLSATL